jgi:hypothetical protein
VAKGMEAMSWSFISQNNEYISPSTPLGYGGVGHAVLGTMMIVLIATLISMPIGVATALYITEVRGKAVPYVRFFVQAMSGVPSVVAGLFILTVFILTGALQQSALTGGLAYAILMLPTIARTAEEVLRLIPDELRTGALALGSTRASVVLKVVVPAAKTGLITAMILGIARVVGEPYPDPTQFDPKSEDHDPKSKPENPRWWLTDFEYVAKFKEMLTLEAHKADSLLSEMMVCQRGTRLSITPVESRHFERICALGGRLG